MPGLYIITQGEVEVLNQEMDAQLAILKEGNSIGEMSLIGSGHRSSANLRALSDTECLFCQRETFTAFLKKNPQYELAFYKGASGTLADRLRNTNQKISVDLDKAHALIEKVTEETKVLGYLGTTREGINNTSAHMLHEFFTILPLLEKLCAEHTQDGRELREAKDRIRELAAKESQNIDRFLQQLDMIGQHFIDVLSSLKEGDSLLRYR